MKLLEHEAKDILRARGIPTAPTGGVIRSVQGLSAALRRAGKGPWALKAQVPAGGRGKAGGIQIAKTPAQAREKAKAMLGKKISTAQTQGRSIVIEEILVDKAVAIAREMYLSVVMDRSHARPVVMVSAEGGVEIEELARVRPEAILKELADPDRGLEGFQARRLAFALGIPQDHLGAFTRLAQSVVRIFLEWDASLVEVNPLVITRRGEILALDAKMSLEDNALYRHPEFAARPDREATALEVQAKKAGISYIGLDGNIGCLVNGAGLAMATMDTVKLAGGQPANFLDVGGGANAEQVTRAFHLLLRDKKVKSVLVNIFGGIMKCTTVAEGVLAAVKKVNLRVPLVVRLEGTQVEEGRALLSKSGLNMIGAESLWDAARKAVAAAQSSTVRSSP